MRHIALFLLALVAGSSGLGGCSVYMAMDGRPATDQSVLEVGAPREAIEAELGEPVEIASTDDGCIEATYEVSKAQDPAPMRAVAHGLLDFLTFGIWEAVGIPIEMAVDEASKETVMVCYNPVGVAYAIAPPTRRDDEDDGTAYAVAQLTVEGPPPP